MQMSGSNIFSKIILISQCFLDKIILVDTIIKDLFDSKIT